MTFFEPAGNALWVRSQLADGWDLWLRLAPEDGHPVVAELHVLPSVPEGSTASAASPNMRFLMLSQSAVPWPPPAGGLTARTMRNHLKFGASLASAHAADREWRTHEPTVAASLQAAGFVAREHRRKPGRKPTPDYTYGPDIAAYVEAVRRASREPVKDVAKQLGGAKPENVRDRLSAARKRELLTPTKPGRAAGELTDRGREAVAEAERQGLLPEAKRRRSRPARKE